MTSTLEAQMKVRKATGLRILRQVLARQVKGELGLRIEVWRERIREERRDVYMTQFQQDLELIAADRLIGAGLRQLRRILMRRIKGEVAMRLEVWRATLNIEAFEGQIEVMSKLQADIDAKIEDKKSAGLRLVSRTILRHRGEALRVLNLKFIEKWRENSKLSLQSSLFDKIEARSAKLLKQKNDAAQRTRDATRDLALRRFQQIVMRLMKGEVGMRIQIWYKHMQDQMQAAELDKLHCELEAKAGANQASGLRMLKQTMIRLTKGDLAMRIEIWRVGTKIGAQVKQSSWEVQILTKIEALNGKHKVQLDKIRTELEAKNLHLTHKIAVKELQHTMTRFMKESVGNGILIWRTTMQEEKRAKGMLTVLNDLEADMVDLRTELDAKAASVSRYGGVMMLRQIMARIVSGEVRLCISTWCTAMRNALLVERESDAKKADERFTVQGRNAGLRMMRQVMRRELKGALGMYLDSWRSEMAAVGMASLEFTNGDLRVQLQMCKRRQVELEQEVSRQVKVVEDLQGRLAEAGMNNTTIEATETERDLNTTTHADPNHSLDFFCRCTCVLKLSLQGLVCCGK